MVAARYALAFLVAGTVGSLALHAADAQELPAQFGGAYSSLQPRRQQLVQDWVSRFQEVSGQQVEAGSFYDEIVSLSSKTTFDAVTHALMTTTLTDASGQSMGDALGLIERVDSVRGQVTGASSDRQFRMYVRLEADAIGVLHRSREFTRGPDNTVYHKGYPTSFRQQGGVPSMQVSVAPDGRRADIDVDYRSSSFPAALFNGHLKSSNSDVRAGDNADKHAQRWSGFENWWRGFFGIRLARAPEAANSQDRFNERRVPRAGKKDIEVMAHDFLTAWLVEGDVIAASAYVSERAYACLSLGEDAPAALDRGMAPFQLLATLKAAHEALGPRTSLEGVTTGVRIPNPALKVVTQPHHARFVVSSVPDDIAAAFDCENRLLGPGQQRPRREYGDYYGSTFYVSGRQDQTVALLWAKDEGYWRIVSWQVGVEYGRLPESEAPAVPTVARVKADAALAQAGRGFLEAWLIRKQYDAAFAYLSPRALACYNLQEHTAAQAASPSEAGERIRAGLEAAGKTVGQARDLAAIIEAVEPLHPAVRVMDHGQSRVFALTSLPDALADAMECDARVKGLIMPDSLPLEYGSGFGMNVRFKTFGGDAPVLRLSWRREDGAWRITSYVVELP